VNLKPGSVQNLVELVNSAGDKTIVGKVPIKNDHPSVISGSEYKSRLFLHSDLSMHGIIDEEDQDQNKPLIGPIPSNSKEPLVHAKEPFEYDHLKTQNILEYNRKWNGLQRDEKRAEPDVMLSTVGDELEDLSQEDISRNDARHSMMMDQQRRTKHDDVIEHPDGPRIPPNADIQEHLRNKISEYAKKEIGHLLRMNFDKERRVSSDSDNREVAGIKNTGKNQTVNSTATEALSEKDEDVPWKMNHAVELPESDDQA